MDRVQQGLYAIGAALFLSGMAFAFGLVPGVPFPSDDGAETAPPTPGSDASSPPTTTPADTPSRGTAGGDGASTTPGAEGTEAADADSGEDEERDGDEEQEDDETEENEKRDRGNGKKRGHDDGGEQERWQAGDLLGGVDLGLTVG